MIEYLDQPHEWITALIGAVPFISAYGYKAVKSLTIAIRIGRQMAPLIREAVDEIEAVWEDDTERKPQETADEVETLRTELLAAQEQLSRLRHPSSVTPGPAAIPSKKPQYVGAGRGPVDRPPAADPTPEEIREALKLVRPLKANTTIPPDALPPDDAAIHMGLDNDPGDEDEEAGYV